MLSDWFPLKYTPCSYPPLVVCCLACVRLARPPCAFSVCARYLAKESSHNCHSTFVQKMKMPKTNTQHYHSTFVQAKTLAPSTQQIRMQSATDEDESISPVTEVYLYEQKVKMMKDIRDRKYAKLDTIIQRQMSPRASAPRPYVPHANATTTEAVIDLVSSERDSFEYNDAAPTSIDNTTPARANATTNTPITTFRADTPIACPIPTAVPAYTGYTDSAAANNKPSLPVSKTIIDLINNLQRNGDHLGVERTCCTNNACQYCTGPLMLQRYELAKRLVQLEMHLFGV